jgi:[acyl-carrier-protein] S-malonyltransferase
MTIAFIFPGQGAQQVGMGKDLYEASPAARCIFDTAEQLAHLPLKKLCFEGPQEELARTDVCQPAIFTVSAALLAAMNELLPQAKRQGLQPAFMAGLSLGEYTALYAAGCLSLSDALRLVVRRGQAMQAAATAVPSGMLSVMGLDEAKAQQLCQAADDGEVLTPANFNCPGQIVLSGSLQACRRAQNLAKDFGASGAIPLNVAGAFHSQIMAPAALDLAQALKGVAFHPPSCPVISNVDAQPHGDAASTAGKLLAQLVKPVRWQQSMEHLLGAGVGRFYEIGPGRVLAGLMRRIDRQAEVVSLNSRESLERLAREN